MSTTTIRKGEMPDMKQQDEEEAANRALTERTPVQIGLVLGVLGLVGAGIIAAVAIGSSKISEFSTKLDNITGLLNTAVANGRDLEVKLNGHEKEDQAKWTAIDTRVTVIEKSGSEKTREIERNLNTLQNDFRVHETLSKGSKP